MEVNEITEKIIGSLYKVSNTLGCGFLDKVHINARAIELRKPGLEVKLEHHVPVKYDGVLVGKYVADMLA
jgi:GxxExxY protein